MGLSDRLDGKKVYFDANIIIYLVEEPPSMAAPLQAIRDLIARRRVQACSSELVLCEVLTKPMSNRDENAIRVCRVLLEESGAFELLPTSRATYLLAAELRAELGLKTPDAIHVATAIEARCSVFLSNDVRIRLPTGIEHVALA